MKLLDTRRESLRVAGHKHRLSLLLRADCVPSGHCVLSVGYSPVSYEVRRTGWVARRFASFGATNGAHPGDTGGLHAVDAPLDRQTVPLVPSQMTGTAAGIVASTVATACSAPAPRLALLLALALVANSFKDR